MSEQQKSHSSQEEVKAAGAVFPAYAFHDPEFVEWWLGSLYLLKPQDQIAVAEIVYEAINLPQVQERLAVFVAEQAERAGLSLAQPEPEVEQPPEFEGPRLEQSIQMLKYHFIRYWKSNPWMVVIAGVGLAFAVGRGVWFVGKEVFGIVF